MIAQRPLLNPTSMLISTIALALIHFQSERASAYFYFFKITLKNRIWWMFFCPAGACDAIYLFAGFFKATFRPAVYLCLPAIGISG